MEHKVRIKFKRSSIYKNIYFVQFEEVVLPFDDAIELVNSEIAVIVHIYV